MLMKWARERSSEALTRYNEVMRQGRRELDKLGNPIRNIR